MSINLRCCILSLVVAACGRTSARAPVMMSSTTRQIANLHAFARLYGVVRWFHPSDAAAAIDWDRFAIDGVHRIVDANSPTALRQGLVELFEPVAPTMQLVGAGEALEIKPGSKLESAAGLDLVAWQHRGYGDSIIATGYASKRLHRDQRVALPGKRLAALTQSLDASPYRGSRIRLSGQMRTANHARGQLWMRVDRGPGVTGFFNDMSRYPVTSESWTHGEIIATVDSDATRIAFGMLMVHAGTTWYDDIHLSVEAKDGQWTPIEIQDGSCESPDPMQSWATAPDLGRQGIAGWSITTDHDRPAAGTASLRIETATKLVSEELFREAPEAGESVDLDLGSGLRARVPLTLYSRDHQTVGDDPDVARKTQATVTAPSIGFDALAGAADVIVAWNVLEHFWPYWNDVSVDWTAYLDEALAGALRDRSVDDHVATLERLSAAAPDGHASTACPGESEHTYLPFAVDLVDGHVVVTTSNDRLVERGDVLTSIDGQLVEQRLASEEARVSGSPQWRTVSALQRLARGAPGALARIELRRGAVAKTVTVSRSSQFVYAHPSRPPIDRLADGVYYVDLSRASMLDINAVMDQLAVAPGIVFDVRDRPNSNHQILAHLLTFPPDSRPWVAIPHLIRPGHGSRPASWEETSGWSQPILQALQPRITGRVAFLTGAQAISYAESVMEFVAHYKLGVIVGAATAGTNGDIAQIGEPTGCTTVFTGRRVTRLDGSRHHLIGVQPTIRAVPTLRGVSAGSDEVLDRALGYVRSGR